MILELVEFNSPKGWSRQQVAEEARNVIPKWRANKELLRKHFLLELNGKTGAGVYIWPSVEAAQKAHNEEWRQSVIKRTGGAPTIRYFDLFLLIDNEKGEVIEFPEAAEIRPAACRERPSGGPSRPCRLWYSGPRTRSGNMPSARLHYALGRLHVDRCGGTDRA